MDVDSDAFEEVDEMEANNLPTHSEYIRLKLSAIDEKVFNKTQALQVLQNSREAGNYTQIIIELKGELERLKLERHALEAHQEQTDTWWKNIGLWTASVLSPEVTHIPS